jgi:uncharacterized protein YjaG (DUF416 family)
VDAPQNFDSLEREIESLSPQGRLAFLLSCAERLFPNYLAFSNAESWGDPAALRDALELGWSTLQGEQISPAIIENVMARAEAVTPDTEAFDSPLVSAALDAAVCATLVAELLLHDDPKKVKDAASLARDTVDLHVQELERFEGGDPLLERKILAHPLMKQELARQREDVQLLQEMNWTNKAAVVGLRRYWREPAVSNIGLARPR